MPNRGRFAASSECVQCVCAVCVCSVCVQCAVCVCETFGLSELVEHHQIQWVVEVLGQPGHVLTRQTVGAVDGFVLQVRPVHTVLTGREGQRGIRSVLQAC